MYSFSVTPARRKNRSASYKYRRALRFLSFSFLKLRRREISKNMGTPFVLAAAHACLLGGGLFSVSRAAGTNKRVQEAVIHTPAAPLLIMLSFFVLDRCIAHTAPVASCNVPHGESTLSLIAVVAFGTMIFSNASSAMLSGINQRSVVFALVVHSIIVACYLQLHLGVGSGLPLWPTSYGSVFSPSRVNMWMHSSMTQILSFAAAPCAGRSGEDGKKPAYTIQTALWRVLDTFVMFVLGFLATAPPPSVLPPSLHVPFTILMLITSFPLLFRVLYFLHDALPHFLYVPEDADVAQSTRTMLHAVRPAIVITWLLFPLIWTAAALKLLTPGQEDIAFTACDIAAKAFLTIALQSGAFASSTWQERTDSKSMLQDSHSVVEGFKIFTQCIGHDLRTPMQALVFSNFSAQTLLREQLSVDARATVDAADGASHEARVASATQHALGEVVRPTPLEKEALFGKDALGTALDDAHARGSPVAPRSQSKEGGGTSASGEGDTRVSEIRAQRLAATLTKLEEVGACAELLTCVISNIWDFEKLSTPQKKASTAAATDEMPTEVDVNDVLMHIVSTLKRSPIYKPNVALRTLTDELIPPILWGSRSLLVRGLLNLISNAVKFTEKGHVTAHTVLLSSLDEESVRVRIEVVDTGHGMTDLEMQDARKPYVTATSKGRVSGLGLGLPIVIASIERAGGTFHMDSTVGVGTRCSFELTFSKHDPQSLGRGQGPRPHPASSKTREDRKKRVLVVDDVAMIRDGAAEMIISHGHTVRTAYDGESGLQALKEQAGDLDVALVDIQMPGMCGDQVIVEYRRWERNARPGRRPMRIYACTGNATSVDAANYMNAGFDGCVSKPVYPHTFRSLLSDNRVRVQSALVPGCTHTGSLSPNSSSTSTPMSTPKNSPKATTSTPREHKEVREIWSVRPSNAPPATGWGGEQRDPSPDASDGATPSASPPPTCSRTLSRSRTLRRISIRDRARRSPIFLPSADPLIDHQLSQGRREGRVRRCAHRREWRCRLCRLAG